MKEPLERSLSVGGAENERNDGGVFKERDKYFIFSWCRAEEAAEQYVTTHSS